MSCAGEAVLIAAHESFYVGDFVPSEEWEWEAC